MQWNSATYHSRHTEPRPPTWQHWVRDAGVAGLVENSLDRLCSLETLSADHGRMSHVITWAVAARPESKNPTKEKLTQGPQGFRISLFWQPELSKLTTEKTKYSLFGTPSFSKAGNTHVKLATMLHESLKRTKATFNHATLTNDFCLSLVFLV